MTAPSRRRDARLVRVPVPDEALRVLAVMIAEAVREERIPTEEDVAAEREADQRPSKIKVFVEG